MRYVKYLRRALWVALLAGCTAKDAPAPPAPPAPPQKTVFDPLTRDLDRARDVQKTVDENAAKTRQAVDSQE